MSSFQIYHEEEDKFYTITVNIVASALLGNDVGGPEKSPETKYYLTLSTSIRNPDGSAFPTYLIENLGDTAPGASAATTFTELIDGYAEYFLTQSEFGQSSSSSSSSSEGTSSSSSSSPGA